MAPRSVPALLHRAPCARGRQPVSLWNRERRAPCPAHGRLCRRSTSSRRSAVPRKTVHFHAVVLTRGSRVCLEQRGDDGLWARMWQVPTVESRRALPWRNILAHLSLPAINGQRVGDFTHLTTHREVVFHVYAASTRSRQGRWVDGDELADVPIGVGHRKAIDMAQSLSAVSAS